MVCQRNLGHTQETLWPILRQLHLPQPLTVQVVLTSPPEEQIVEEIG